ncbi:MAG: hypothetical protein IJ640_10505 [Prevotella sp.]|nr:hypothetical protein [Prevotella sp.]
MNGWRLVAVFMGVPLAASFCLVIKIKTAGITGLKCWMKATGAYGVFLTMERGFLNSRWGG